MIDLLFTDKKFLQLTNPVRLTVIYFASIGVRDIDYNQLDKNEVIIYNIIKHPNQFKLEQTKLEIESHFQKVLIELKQTKFKLKLSQLKFTPPTTVEAMDYILTNMDKLKDGKSIGAIKTDIENFTNYYKSIDWKVGKKKKMTNWKTALIRWLNSDWNKGKGISQMSESMKAFMQIQKETPS